MPHCALNARRGRARTAARLAVVLALISAIGGTPVLGATGDSSDSEPIPPAPGRAGRFERLEPKREATMRWLAAMALVVGCAGDRWYPDSYPVPVIFQKDLTREQEVGVMKAVAAVNAECGAEIFEAFGTRSRWFLPDCVFVTRRIERTPKLRLLEAQAVIYVADSVQPTRWTGWLLDVIDGCPDD